MKSWKPLCIYLDSEPHPPNKPKVYPLHSLVDKTRKANIKKQGLLLYVHSVIRGTDVKLSHGSQDYIDASCMSLIIFLRLMTARYFVCQFRIQIYIPTSTIVIGSLLLLEEVSGLSS